jgi:hypothetical protein
VDIVPRTVVKITSKARAFLGDIKAPNLWNMMFFFSWSIGPLQELEDGNKRPEFSKTD